MAEDGWSRALMAASGVPVAGARDEGWRALVMEASQSALTRDRMEELSRHRDPAVREAIAGRRDLPLGLQASLVHDRRASVRTVLAANSTIGAAIAGVLAEDRDTAVLKALARGEGVPRAVLTILAAHRREDVARLAQRALDGVVLAPGGRLPEIEERHGTARATTTDEASPAQGREGRTLAPRPTVGRLRHDGPTSGPGAARWA